MRVDEAGFVLVTWKMSKIPSSKGESASKSGTKASAASSSLQHSHITDLPYDALAELSMHLEPLDIFFGLSETDHHFHRIFQSERYWEERVKIRWPAIYNSIAARHPRSSRNGDPLFWRKFAYRCEGIRENFKQNRMISTTWASFAVDGYYPDEEGEEEEYSGMMDVSCVAFCNNGHVLAFGDSDKYEVLYWNTGNSRPPYAGPPEILRHLHKDIICSLKGLDHRVSSGSYDCTIGIVDFNRPEARPRYLRATERVLSHTWLPSCLVAGHASGGFEVFDLRTDKPVLTKEHALDPVELFDGIEVQVDDDRILAVGWEGEVRKVKIFDLRTGDLMKSVTVPGITMPPAAGHWGQRIRYGAVTHLQEGQLYLGAENGKVFQYDAKSGELVTDFTETLGHVRQIVGLHCTGSQLISLSRSGRTGPDLFYRTVVHDLSDGYPLLWQHNIPGATGSISANSAMDFCDDRCALAVALTNQIQFWRPLPRSRRRSVAEDADALNTLD